MSHFLFGISYNCDDFCVEVELKKFIYEKDFDYIRFYTRNDVCV